MKRLDPAVWHVISPLFDRALDLEAGARRAFLDALRANDDNQSKTAKQLHIGTATLYRKLKRYGGAPRRDAR